MTERHILRVTHIDKLRIIRVSKKNSLVQKANAVEADLIGITECN
jgi:hypothetical protein